MSVPLDLVEKAAEFYAQERWPGSRLISSTPYYAFDGSINAYAVQFAKTGSPIYGERDIAKGIALREERVATIRATRAASEAGRIDSDSADKGAIGIDAAPEVTISPTANGSGQGGVRMKIPPSVVQEAARRQQEVMRQNKSLGEWKREIREAENAAVLPEQVGTVIIAARYDQYPLLERFDGAAPHQKNRSKMRKRLSVPAQRESIARTFYVGPIIVFHEPENPKVSPTGPARNIIANPRTDEVFDLSKRAPSADQGRLGAAPTGKNSRSPQEVWDSINKTGSPISGAGEAPRAPAASPTVQIQGVPYYHQDDYGANSCGPVASAQALGYWDDNGYGNLVDNGSSTSGHEDELISNLMKSEAYSPTIGTYGNKIKSGIEAVCNNNEYGNDLNFLVTVKDQNVSWANDIKAEIAARHPFIYFNWTKTKYPNWAHFTTGVGYNETSGHLLFVNYNYAPDTPYELNWDNIDSNNEALYKISTNGTPSFDCLWSEDFEGSSLPGWGVSHNGSSPGHWDETSYRAHNQTPNPYPPGGDTAYSAWCMRSNIAPPGPFAKNANGWMIYGPFSTYKSTGELAAYIWRNIPGTGGSYVALFASLDGSNFSGTGFWGNYPTWNRCVLNFDSVFGLGNIRNKPNVWVAVWFHSDAGATAEGAYVDNITLKMGPATHFTVTSPKGGESWLRGTAHDITWLSMGNLGLGNVNLKLYKNGFFFADIVGSAPNNGTYHWTIPSLGSGGGDFKIRVGNPADAAQYGYSPSNFEIVALPSITVLQPNGGQIWQKGAAYPIQWSWTGYPGNNVRIVAINANNYITEITSSTPNTGSYSWMIPQNFVADAGYRIRVTSTANAQYTDISDSGFSVVIPSIQITYPRGGEWWQRGQNRGISWTSVGNTGANVKIDLYQGRMITPIIASTPNDGSHTWAIPGTLTPASNYKIRVSSTSTAGYDFSEDITITSGPALCMISPNGGEEWSRNSTNSIRWTGTETVAIPMFPPPPVKLQLFKSDVLVSTITASTPNTGVYNWDIPSSTTPGSDYKIRVAEPTEAFDAFSSSTFRIKGPTLTLTSPVGKTGWLPGSVQEIAWASDGLLKSNIRILLYLGDILNTTITASTADTGSYRWMIPARQKPGSNYRLKIVATADPYVFDISSYPIAIQLPPSITLDAPNGGEAWAHGTMQTLRWNSSGIPDTTVRLDLCRGGQMLQTITTTTVFLASFDWKIPPSLPEGDDYKIRITSFWNQSFDESNGAIKIFRNNGIEEKDWQQY